MKTICTIIILNEALCRCVGLKKDHQEYLYDKFGIYASNYYFSPKYKMGQWDGKIRFFYRDCKTYVYLLDQIVPILIKLGYGIDIKDNRRSSIQLDIGHVDKDYFSHIIDPETDEPISLRPYQVEMINTLLNSGFGIGLAGTGAGKTMVCAAMVQKYNEHNLRSLVIVPSVDLVEQTTNDLRFFQVDAGMYYGKKKELDRKHCVSTWQALRNIPDVIQLYDVVIVDEAHGLKAAVLKNLLNEYGKNIRYRFGVTGTLPKEEADALSVKTALGNVKYEVPAHELIEKGYLAKLNIDIFQLKVDLTDAYNKHLKDNKLDNSKFNYQTFKNGYFPDWESEKSFLQMSPKRLEWISSFLTEKQNLNKGNILCLVNGINIGKKLSDMIENSIFIYGKDKVETRKEAYKLFENNNNLLVIATVHIASTGLNIKRIFNLVYIDMGKSFIRTIQTIGRGLRKAADKENVVITDICSDLKYSKRHLSKRRQFYTESRYPNKIKMVNY